MSEQTQRDQSYCGPEMTLVEFYWLRTRIAQWLRIKAQFEPKHPGGITTGMLTQLAADVEHSSLLLRMVQERKEPLPEPPPLDHAYPVYPD